jgi:hypothetical protein
MDFNIIAASLNKKYIIQVIFEDFFVCLKENKSGLSCNVFFRIAVNKVYILG